MTLPRKGPIVKDPVIEQRIRGIEQQSPLTRQHLSDGIIGSTQIENGSVTDTDLASPNNAIYRTLFSAKGTFSNDATAATYMLGTFLAFGTVAPLPSGSGATTAADLVPDIFRLDDDDYAVAGKTTKCRVIATIAANATATTRDFTFGLYPVTVAGGADDIDFTLGTVVTGSTVAISAPSASTVTGSDGSDFDMPSTAGGYVLGVVLSGTIANNSAVAVYASLQMRHT